MNWRNTLILIALCITGTTAAIWADQNISTAISSEDPTELSFREENGSDKAENRVNAAALDSRDQAELINSGSGLALPPEVLRSLLESGNQQKHAEAATMSARTRLVLILAAVISVMAGVIVCQLLAGRLFGEVNQGSIFLIFGLFSAIGALCLACGLVGSLRLHLVAVICTLLSGFCLGGIGLGPTPWFRGWLMGNNANNSEKMTPASEE